MSEQTKVKVYVVGGCVRGRLLGLHPKDHDYVVVGADHEWMINAGFKQVGADFPVYLHHESGDEYALARTERKTAAGYNGFETDFSPDITLEEDLMRRDLTVNAMAREVIEWDEHGNAKLSDDIIDPFNGQKDLKNEILRHVSDAFAEDPVRVLRTARFAARYGFDIDPATIKLMTKLVDDGELDHLVSERVWTEFEKAMSEENPLKFFRTLKDCGADVVLFPELGRSLIDTGWSLNIAALHNLPTVERLVIIFSGIPHLDAKSLLERLKAPIEVQRLTRKTKKLLDVLSIFGAWDVPADDILTLLNDIDAFGNNDDVRVLTSIISLFSNKIRDRFDNILQAFRKAAKVSFLSLTNKQQDELIGPAIGKAINKLRLAKIKEVFKY